MADWRKIFAPLPNPQTTIKGDGGAALTILGLFLLGIFWLVGADTAVWLWPDSKLANEWKYFLDDDLKDATLSLPPRPHDCEFLTAPMGSKHCHYEKRVFTIRIRTDSQGRRVSMDDGKTWTIATPSDHAAVLISWERVEE